MVFESAAVLETPAGRFQAPDCETEDTPPARLNEHHEPLAVPFLERETRFPLTLPCQFGSGPAISISNAEGWQ